MDRLPNEVLGMILDELKPSCQASVPGGLALLALRKLFQSNFNHEPSPLLWNGSRITKFFRFRQNIQSPEKGIIYVKDSMHTFYQEAGCFFTSMYQCREFAIERFLNSVFASFKNLAAVEPGDSAAFTTPRCRPIYFGNRSFTTADADVMFRSVTPSQIRN